MSYWTAAAIARAKQLRAEGYPSSHTAHLLGVSRNAVCGLLDRLRKAGHFIAAASVPPGPAPAGKRSYPVGRRRKSDEPGRDPIAMIALARKMRAGGSSQHDIAITCQRSRKWVYKNTLGVEVPAHLRPKPKRAPKPKTAAAPSICDEIGPADPLRAGAFLPLPGRTPISIIELTAFVCHWPIDARDGSFAGYCGAPCGQGPYCSVHAAMSYRKADSPPRYDGRPHGFLGIRVLDTEAA